MAKNMIRNPDAVLAALRSACEHREILILVTPYLRFETTFQRLDPDAIHVAATMAYEDALYGLKSPDLRMRFPNLHVFLDAPTKLLGLGMDKGRRTLRLAIPKVLEEDEQRRGYRVERVGRVNVTFSTRRYDLISGTLVNISTGGVRLMALRDFEDGEVDEGDVLAITVPLNADIHINVRAVVRYSSGRALGLEFRPPLEGYLLERLARWVFQRREEDIVRSQARPALGGEATAQRLHQGLVLVGGDEGLRDRLAAWLTDLPEVTRLAPNVQALKEVDLQSQILLLFHLPSLGLDERRRLKTLVEPFMGRIPFLLLATGEVDGGVLSELGSEVKAAAVFKLGENPSPIFRRLVQGIFRRHFEEGATEGA